jgi:hypothetical protein
VKSQDCRKPKCTLAQEQLAKQGSPIEIAHSSGQATLEHTGVLDMLNSKCNGCALSWVAAMTSQFIRYNFCLLFLLRRAIAAQSPPLGQTFNEVLMELIKDIAFMLKCSNHCVDTHVVCQMATAECWYSH